MIKGIAALFQLLLGIFGLVKTQKEQATGAALQRGRDYGEETKRLVVGINAGNEPLAPDGVLVDKNNRDNADGTGDSSSGVQLVAGTDVLSKE
jgi:hypothetical protein